jgi:hypothetical protein
MKTFSLSILISALLSRTNAAEQKHIDEACSDVWGVINCDSSVTYPYDAVGIYGKILQFSARSRLISMMQTIPVPRQI